MTYWNSARRGLGCPGSYLTILSVAGTGKSNLTANLTATMAQASYPVGVLDTDVQSPGIHVLFGLDEDRMDKALSDYLWEVRHRGGGL